MRGPKDAIKDDGTYVWRRRKGEWVKVDKQIVRWQLARFRATEKARKAAKKAEAEAAQPRDLFDKKMFG